MPNSRKSVIISGEPVVVHCESRCVRRAWLCGWDPLTEKSYEHRRFVIYELLKKYSQVFALELFACSVLHNHYHFVARIDPHMANGWSDEEVVRRWDQVYSVRKVFTGVSGDLDEDILKKALARPDLIKEWRSRLCCISWFMKQINEPMARMANKEDGCKGRFWEGRFKCQRLEDEGAVLASMTYVDLNPVRAGVAETPEESDFTSVQDRIMSMKGAESGTADRVDADQQRMNSHDRSSKQREARADWLTPIENIKIGLGDRSWLLKLEDYLEIVDTTGRIIKSNKKGFIPSNLEPVLSRMKLCQNHWIQTVLGFGSGFYRVAGSVSKMIEIAKSLGQRWMRGMNFSKEVYVSA